MARARNIKPGIMANEDLAECSVGARLLYVYLWMLADRKGRLEDRPKRIGIQALPYDDFNISELLQELHDAGFVIRYSKNESKYIQVVNFDKHQTPHVKEKASTIPAPDNYDTGKVQEPDKHSASTGVASPDSLILRSSDSQIPDSHDSDESPKGDSVNELFDLFWTACKAAYEKTQSSLGSKANAKKQFVKLKPDRSRVIELSNILHAQAANKIARRDVGQFAENLQNVERWLRNERWLDEIAPAAVASTNVEPIRKRVPFPL